MKTVFTKGRKYINELEEAMIKEGRITSGGLTPWTWGKKDERKETWKKSRAVYGFDEREMWNGYETMLMLLYERLRWWQDHKMLDMSGHFYLIDGKKRGYDFALNYLIESIKLMIVLDDLDPLRATKYKKRLETWGELFMQIAPSVGW